MKRVGVRDLKNNLSRYLREVLSGEQIAVTDRGKVVAVLRLPDEEAARDPREAAYKRLVAEGRLLPPQKPTPDWTWIAELRRQPLLTEAEVRDLVDQIRSD